MRYIAVGLHRVEMGACTVRRSAVESFELEKMKILPAARGSPESRFPLRSARHPFPIASSRVVNCTFISAVVTPGRPARLVEFRPGVTILVRDIEDEQILFTCRRGWYRSHIDEFIEATAPAGGDARVHSL